MIQRILFIINPISGDIQKANLPAAIESILDASRFLVEIVYTERAGHAMHLAKEAVEREFDIVVAVGGDGSINEIAQTLIHTEVILAVVPLGSGNGFAQHLGLPIRNIKKALKVINSGKVVRVDTGKSNLGSFVSCAGEGLDASVARTYRHQSIRGFTSYFIAVIKDTLFNYKPSRLAFETDQGKQEMEVLLFSVFNSRYYGYGVSLYPSTSMNDGHFNVVVVPKLKWWQLLYVVFMGLIGKIEVPKQTTVLKTKKVIVHRNNKRVVQLDGDSIMTSSPFELELLEKSLNVLVDKDFEIDKL